MYKVERSRFNGLYLVINSLTGLAQSSWDNPYDANRTCKDLNNAFNASLVAGMHQLRVS